MIGVRAFVRRHECGTAPVVAGVHGIGTRGHLTKHNFLLFFRLILPRMGFKKTKT